VEIKVGGDSSLFIEQAIRSVWMTLVEAALLVTGVVFLFLGSWRATIVPMITVPICLLATFAVLWLFGYSVNLLTLLALVLAIGLVVDDAIVVLENIYHRIEQGEPPLYAAYAGARQVGFAVVATTLVVCAVFLPVIRAWLAQSGSPPPPATARVHPDDVDAMTAAITEASGGAPIAVVADPSLVPGAIELRGPAFELSHSWTARLPELRAQILTALSGLDDGADE
jgi:hypothetical protein